LGSWVHDVVSDEAPRKRARCVRAVISDVAGRDCVPEIAEAPTDLAVAAPVIQNVRSDYEWTYLPENPCAPFSQPVSKMLQCPSIPKQFPSYTRRALVAGFNHHVFKQAVCEIVRTSVGLRRKDTTELAEEEAMELL